MPVVGLTEDSQKVLDENFKAFQDFQQKKKEQWMLQQELEEKTGVQIPEFTMQGSSVKVLEMGDEGSRELVEDKYKVNGEEKEKEMSEEVKVKVEREQFLNIYKEDDYKIDVEEEKDVGTKEIKFK